MSSEPSDHVRRRRRGPQLEAALLAAAWDELVEAGYARLTMESVAARAQTGVAVLYRRWPNKDQLVVAAIERQRAANPVADVDTGTLRGDLVANLTAAGQALAGVYAIASAAAFSGLRSEDAPTAAQVRDRVLGTGARRRVRPLYRRAAARGELDLARVPRVVLEMPFDLVRHDLLMDLAPPRPARIRAIVDDLFMPLVNR